MQHFLKVFLNFFCSQFGKKLFPCLIEHERHSLGVSKLSLSFSLIRPGHILETSRFLSLRYSADFRRSRLVSRRFILLRKNCNVRQKTLQKFLKISIKNSKCATSNKHIQDGRPGRYENRRGSKIKAKHHQRMPPHHPGTRMSEMSSPRSRENQEFCHLTAKRQGFGRKVPNETIVPRR